MRMPSNPFSHQVHSHWNQMHKLNVNQIRIRRACEQMWAEARWSQSKSNILKMPVATNIPKFNIHSELCALVCVCMCGVMWLYPQSRWRNISDILLKYTKENASNLSFFAWKSSTTTTTLLWHFQCDAGRTHRLHSCYRIQRIRSHRLLGLAWFCVCFYLSMWIHRKLLVRFYFRDICTGRPFAIAINTSNCAKSALVIWDIKGKPT